MPRPVQIVLLSLAGPVGFILYNLFAETINRALGQAWHPGESPLGAFMGSAAVCLLLHAALFVFCLCRWTTRVGRDIVLSFVAFSLSLGLVLVGAMLGLIPG